MWEETFLVTILTPFVMVLVAPYKLKDKLPLFVVVTVLMVCLYWFVFWFSASWQVALAFLVFVALYWLAITQQNRAIAWLSGLAALIAPITWVYLAAV